MKTLLFENERVKLYVEVTEENKYKVTTYWKLLQKYRIYQHDIFDNAEMQFYNMVKYIITC